MVSTDRSHDINAFRSFADSLAPEDFEALSNGLGIGKLASPGKTRSASLSPSLSSPSPSIPKTFQLVVPVQDMSMPLALLPQLEPPSQDNASKARPRAPATSQSRDVSSVRQSSFEIESLLGEIRREAQANRVEQRRVVARTANRLVIQVSAFFLDIAFVISTLFVVIAGAWTIANLSMNRGGGREASFLSLTTSWLAYFKPLELIGGLIVCFVLYKFIFRFVVGCTPAQRLLGLRDRDSTATSEAV